MELCDVDDVRSLLRCQRVFVPGDLDSEDNSDGIGGCVQGQHRDVHQIPQLVEIVGQSFIIQLLALRPEHACNCPIF